jgi:taurine dioxygenase
MSGLEVRPISGALGAEVHGVDLARLDDAGVAGVRQALLDHGVIFFRDQRLSPEQQIAFAERFGPINVNRFFAHVDGHPMIAEVRKEPDQKRNLGEVWHTDHSYDAVPALGSMLLAREVPSVGGDTMFASMIAAYDALSDGLKRTLETLRAEHSSRHVFGPKAGYLGSDLDGRLGNRELATQDAVHPVVIRHPDTGRKALYVSRSHTIKFKEMSEEESRPLIDFLQAHQTRPEFTCRVRWQPGTLTVWDNRCTQHSAVNDYHGQRRRMRRLTVGAQTPR